MLKRYDTVADIISRCNSWCGVVGPLVAGLLHATVTKKQATIGRQEMEIQYLETVRTCTKVLNEAWGRASATN